MDVKSLSSIKVKSKDFFGKEDKKVKLTIFDGNKEIGSSHSGFEVTSTADAFKFKCSESKDLSIELELPVESPGMELVVSAFKSIVQVVGIQAKSIKINLEQGNVVLKNLKSDLIKADTSHGDIKTKGLLLGKKIELEAENGVKHGKILNSHIYFKLFIFSRISQSKNHKEITSKQRLNR